MAITTTTLTRAAGVAAAVGGLLYAAVQINHPPLDLDLVVTTEWKVREAMKVLFASLALTGVTGMYLRQAKQTGLLGLVGYLLLSVNFLILLGFQIIAVVVLPAIASSSPGYVIDALAVAGGGHPAGDVGLLELLSHVGGATYVAGGLIFGIALFRADILVRWAAVLLSASSVATLAIPLLPQVNQRLFAIPFGIALVGLGYSLWRQQHTRGGLPLLDPAVSPLDPVRTK